jgi:hypothetical protein
MEAAAPFRLCSPAQSRTTFDRKTRVLSSACSKTYQSSVANVRGHSSLGEGCVEGS